MFKKYAILLFLIIFIALLSCQQEAKPNINVVPSATPDILATISYVPLTENVDLMRPLPEWFSDPDTDILLFRNFTFALFINPKTHETYRLELPEAAWISNMMVGFSPVEEEQCRTKYAYSQALDLLTENINEIEKDSLPDYRKKGGKYFEQFWVDTRISFLMADDEPYLPPSPGRFLKDVSSSATHLFVLEGADNEASNGEQIIVLDIDSKAELVRLDGKEILPSLKYVDGENKLLYLEADTLCVFDVLTYEKTCDVKFHQGYFDIELLGFYTSASEVIFFSDIIESDLPWFQGNKLCVLDVSSGEAKCLTEDIDILQRKEIQVSRWHENGEVIETVEVHDAIVEYQFSPNFDYLYFCRGRSYETLEFRMAVVKIGEENSFEIPHSYDTVDWRNMCWGGMMLWRPMP